MGEGASGVAGNLGLIFGGSLGEGACETVGDSSIRGNSGWIFNETTNGDSGRGGGGERGRDSLRSGLALGGRGEFMALR